MFVSCDSMREREAIKNYTSPYMGTYVGELSGNVTGALIINIKRVVVWKLLKLFRKQ